jgi:hypothetical protein
MKKAIPLSAIILFNTALNALTLSGIGYGSLEHTAQKEALADLSSKISVEVKSNFQSITKTMDKNYSSSKTKTIDLSSDLPILGAQFENSLESAGVRSNVTITSHNAITLYVSELKRLKKNILFLHKELGSVQNTEIRYDLLKQIFNDIENFNKHKVVATILGAANLPTLNITKNEIFLELNKLEHIKASSISIAAKILTKNITQKKIYISSATTSNSYEITQFAKLLKNELSTQIDSVKYPKDAEYFLKGEYQILKDSLFINYRLLDIRNNITKSMTVTLEPSAYIHTNYKPNTKSFDAAINSEFVKSGNLDVKIGFKGYNRANGIDLNSADTVDIVLKSNKSICYFLIGHTLKENNKFSYLLPIGDEDQPFINRITGEDVNRYIIIAQDVPIDAPYGSENLQVFASTLDTNHKCNLSVPKCFETDQGYCVVGSQPSKAVTTTRALNFKKKKKNIEQAESSISWTSFK